MRAKFVMLLSALLVAASLMSTSALASRVRSVAAPAVVPSGLALLVDHARSLPVKNGCSHVQTGTSAALATVAVDATAGAKASNIRLGANVWKLKTRQSFSAVVWLPLTTGTH